MLLKAPRNEASLFLIFVVVNVDIFYESKGILPRTPQQNEVAKKKNKVFQEMARVMLHMHNTLT